MDYLREKKYENPQKQKSHVNQKPASADSVQYIRKFTNRVKTKYIWLESGLHHEIKSIDNCKL